MFAIIGIVVVFGAVLGGYSMEHGNVKVLLQPAELLIIGGAGAGTVLIANPPHILKQIAGGIVVVFKGSSITKQCYDVEDPDKSSIFSKDAEFLKNHHVRYFFATACVWQSAAWKRLSSIS
jgi:chemotaxis protein MotA